MKKFKKYISPEIQIVKLDCEISLQLESSEDPMGEPIWGTNNLKQNIFDPYKTNNV